MEKKKYNVTISTTASTEDYYGVTYESKKDGIVIYKGDCTVIYPMCNIVRIVIRNA